MNETNNNLASDDWIDASIDKRYAPGKVPGDEWRLGVWNAQRVNDYKMREFLDTMHTHKIDILCQPETKKKGCEIANIGN